MVCSARFFPSLSFSAFCLNQHAHTKLLLSRLKKERPHVSGSLLLVVTRNDGLIKTSSQDPGKTNFSERHNLVKSECRNGKQSVENASLLATINAAGDSAQIGRQPRVGQKSMPPLIFRPGTAVNALCPALRRPAERVPALLKPAP